MTNSQNNLISSDSMDPSLLFNFLLENGISSSVLEQFKCHAIDCLSFGLITEQDLQEMKITQIGHRKRLLFLSSIWHSYLETVHSRKLGTGLSNSLHGTLRIPKNGVLSNGVSTFSFKDNINHDTLDGHGFQARFLNSDALNSKDCISQNFDLLKLIISGLYFFIVTGITSFIMVLAHERLPDISKYPPLPDLFLDNLPYITWAFPAAEWVGVVLSILWCIILLFHRHRCILLRRFFALSGTVFLLRSFTMIITSLSVPGQHLAEQCSPYIAKNESQRIKRVFEIWFGFGMTISGIQTCGDYMFSGHTACLTLLNFFITEYAPRRYQPIHTFSWVLNLFGIFFILASHEHYSIDVFVAIYVSSRLFLYYHCLANSNILDLPDHERTMIWFPLFSFLEYDVRGIVPNEYEIPFKRYLDSLKSINPELFHKSGETQLLVSLDSEGLSSTITNESNMNGHRLESKHTAHTPDISGDCVVQYRS